MLAQSLPPGPRAPRALQAALWGIRYVQFTQAAHRRFGSTFTVRPGTFPPIVLTSDRDAARRLFTGDPLGKRHGNETIRPMIGDRSVMLLEPGEHLQRRKLLLPPFHGDRVRGYARLMEELIDAEIDRWAGRREIRLLPIAQDLTMEVILRAVLGVQDPALRERLRLLLDDLIGYPFGPLRRWARGRPRLPVPVRVQRALELAALVPGPSVMTHYPEFKQRSRINVLTRAWWQMHDELGPLLDAHIAATRADPGLAERDDILAMLVQGDGISDADLREELWTLIGAGHETTAAAIAWGAELLARNPSVADRAREDDDAYLDALVKEVLRIREPIPIAAVRVLDEPFPVDGHVVPAGVHIAIDSHALHHDPELYPDPEAFRPERFLDAAPAPYAWLPFGGGAHRCVGYALAELEIKIALRAILRRVDLEPVTEELPPRRRRAVTEVPSGGARLGVRPRSARQAEREQDAAGVGLR